MIEEWNLEELSKEKEKFHFVIPMYQRRYAWERKEVRQLLKDLDEWSDKEEYFIGNIVVEEIDGKLNVIDGQQRLTTLYLMAATVGEPPFELDYAVRDSDREFLKELKSLEMKEKEIQKLGKSTKADPIFEENIDEIFRFETVNITTLLEKVKFTLTSLKSDDLDVAKYFEVMNNRGKQLEKHEILKSYFLNDTSEDDRWDEEKSAYAVIWDYCSRMETFFEDFIVTYERREKEKDKKIVDVRKQIIDVFDGKKNFANLLKQNGNENDNNPFGRKSIEDLLDEKNPESESSREGVDTHQTPLKFSYFLLHVLDIWLHKKKCDKKVLYNDAKLLDQFIDIGSLDVKNMSIEDKKAFIHFLFKCRILYDYYIFHRDDKKVPVLRRIVSKDEKWIKEQNVDLELLNIQLLFSLSADFHTQEWIAPVLSFLLEKSDSTIFGHYDTLREFLEKLDDALAAKRLENGKLKEIYQQAILEKNLNNKVNELDKEKVTEKVNQGVATENYWFYRLDYKLWKAFEHRNEEGNPWKGIELKKVSAKKEMIETFYLKNLNSVEHIYPQTPTDECEENWQKDKKCLDSFGNLALISKHMNSKLSNQCFEKKSVDVKNQIEKSTVESLKLLLVFAKYDKWTAENCEKHQNEMVGLLQKPHHAAGS